MTDVGSLAANSAMPTGVRRVRAVDADPRSERHGAATIFLGPKGRVLLIRRSSKEKNYAGHWALPGGRADAGETPEQAARREATEELGYCPPGAGTLFDDRVSPNGVRFRTFLHRVDDEFEPALNDEHDDHRWVETYALLSPMHPAVKENLKKLGDQMLREEKLRRGDADPVLADAFAGDDLGSVREKDRDGHLHVARTPITRAVVSDYFGREISGWQALGLDAERKYKLYRDAEELRAGADTFVGKPVLLRHRGTTASDHPRDITVGAIGGPIEMDGDTVYAPITLWDAEAIKGVEDGSKRGLSCGYYYKPDMTPGTAPDGSRYDGRMTKIVGNHLALVTEPRVQGSMVADSAGGFEESKHPRAENGQFGSGGGGSSESHVSKLTTQERGLLAQLRTKKGGRFSSPHNEAEVAEAHKNHLAAVKKSDYESPRHRADEIARTRDLYHEAEGKSHAAGAGEWLEKMAQAIIARREPASGGVVKPPEKAPEPEKPAEKKSGGTDVGHMVKFRVPYVDGHGKSGTRGQAGIVQRVENGKFVVKSQEGGIHRLSPSDLVDEGYAIPGMKERLDAAEALYQKSKEAPPKKGKKPAGKDSAAYDQLTMENTDMTTNAVVARRTRAIAALVGPRLAPDQTLDGLQDILALDAEAEELKKEKEEKEAEDRRAKDAAEAEEDMKKKEAEDRKARDAKRAMDRKARDEKKMADRKARDEQEGGMKSWLKGKLGAEDYAKACDMIENERKAMDAENEEIEEENEEEGADPDDKTEKKSGFRPPSKDKKARDRAHDSMGMDAKAVESLVKSAQMTERRTQAAIYEARRAVQPVVGELSVAFDSAEDVYASALRARGVKTDGVHPSAYKALFDMLPRKGLTPSVGESKLALDSSARSKAVEMAPGLANIKIGA